MKFSEHWLRTLVDPPLDSDELHPKRLHPTLEIRIIHRFVCGVIELLDNRRGRTLGHEESIPRDRFEIGQALLVRSCERRE